MRFIQGVLLLIFLGSVAIFAFQNNQPVAVSFLKWRTPFPVSIALLSVAAYLLGMLSGWTVVAFVRRSIRKVSEHQD
ncbi:MAG TPA: LapA family protein [Isosphaeraceae bacterium]